MTQLALLVAIQVVFTLTPLGFLPLGVMTITLMHLPTLIGAIILGPSAGAFLGFTFGISSIISANLRGTPDVMVYSPFLSGSMWSVVIAIVPRVIFPIVTAYVYRALLKAKLFQRVSAGISAAIGTALNTILVLSSIYLLLGEMYATNIGVPYNTLLAAFAAVAVTNGTVEVIVAVLISVALVKPLSSYLDDSQ